MKRLLVVILCLFANALMAQTSSLNNGLVAYYPFNGNANDESRNGNHGTVNGATLTTDRFGNASSAYSFNGAGNYISVKDASTLKVKYGFSISIWVNPYRNCETLIRKGLDYGIDLGNYQNNGAGTNILFFDNKGKGLCKDIALPNNIWSNIVCTYDGSKAFIYLNGKLSNTCNSFIGNIENSNSYLTIGSLFNDEGYWGQIDDVAIYNRALTGSEIQSLYTAGGYKPSTDSYSSNPQQQQPSGGNSGATTTTCKVLDVDINASYEGACKDGLAHGYGKAKGKDTYEGNFQNGLEHGKGTYNWASGARYEGDWENGKMQGIGVYTFPSGTVKRGQFKDNVHVSAEEVLGNAIGNALKNLFSGSSSSSGSSDDNSSSSSSGGSSYTWEWDGSWGTCLGYEKCRDLICKRNGVRDSYLDGEVSVRNELGSSVPRYEILVEFGVRTARFQYYPNKNKLDKDLSFNDKYSVYSLDEAISKAIDVHFSAIKQYFDK